MLKDPARNVVINMLGVSVDHRPEFFAHLLPALAELRSRTGRPHWLVIDEAHHMLPASWEPAAEIPLRPHGTLYVTVHPGSVAPSIIETIETVITVGEQPDETLRAFAEIAGLLAPAVPAIERLPSGRVLYWKVGHEPVEVATEQPRLERTRHSRKYTEGNLGRDRSFYFRGPEQKLKLRAHNLQMFLLIADGVDDDTWLHHLRNGEYSAWLRAQVKDKALTNAIAAVERDVELSAGASRAAIREAIESRYTLPADTPTGRID